MRTIKFAFCLFVLLSVPAYAIQKCIALNTSTACQNITPEQYHTDWGSNCNGIAIRGVSVCGHKDGGNADNRAVDSVWISSNPYENTDCFCKIVQPVVSRWVFAEPNDNNASNCLQYCPLACAGKLADQSNSENVAFRNVILGAFYE